MLLGAVAKTSCINLMKERLREHKNVELLDFAPLVVFGRSQWSHN